MFDITHIYSPILLGTAAAQSLRVWTNSTMQYLKVWKLEEERWKVKIIAQK